MTYVIEKLAPDTGRSLAGVVLQSAAGMPGVTVQVDWPVFLGHPAEEVDRMYAERLAWLQAEQEATQLRGQRSERVKAGLARRKAEGKPVGRQPGTLDKRPRRRSGYVARWERERDERSA